MQVSPLKAVARWKAGEVCTVQDLFEFLESMPPDWHIQVARNNDSSAVTVFRPNGEEQS